MRYGAGVGRHGGVAEGVCAGGAAAGYGAPVANSLTTMVRAPFLFDLRTPMSAPHFLR